MCVIMYKPKGIEMPNNIILENCFDNNPDGAGLMYKQRNDRIKIIKGFMDCGQLYDSLDRISMTNDITETDLVIHFRYATQGKICPENCHPFPLSNNKKELKSIETESNVGIAHNGIVSFCTDKGKNPLSDTQIFIKNYLSQIPEKQINNPAILDLIYQATNSKFAIISAQKTNLIGNFILDNDIYYSNDSYKTRIIRYTNKTGKKYKIKNYDNCYLDDDIICNFDCDNCKTFACCNDF